MGRQDQKPPEGNDQESDPLLPIQNDSSDSHDPATVIGTSDPNPYKSSPSTSHFAAIPSTSSAQPFVHRNSEVPPPLGRIKSSRQGSYSSVETADLMDHRNVFSSTQPDLDFSNGSLPGPGSFINRRRRSSTGPVGSFLGNRVSNQMPIRGNTFNSPNFVERLVRRGRSGSKAPLLNSQNEDAVNEYNSFTEHMRTNSMNRIREALAIDVENLAAEPGMGNSSSNHFPQSLQNEPNDRNLNLSRLLDDSDGSEILGSEPLSRRSSSGSSLGDVCLPVDSLPNVSTSSRGGCNFNLSYLEEFAINEQNELKAIQEAIPADLIYNVDQGRRPVPSISGVNVSHTVNEIDLDGGRLRPYRIVPWNNTNGSKTQSPYLGASKPSLGEFKSRFNHSTDKLADLPTGRGKSKKSQPDFNIGNAESSDSLGQGPILRFTYFREDLESTVHSSSISGLLQPGQTFDDLFNISTYGTRPRSESNHGQSAANSMRNLNITTDSVPEATGTSELPPLTLGAAAALAGSYTQSHLPESLVDAARSKPMGASKVHSSASGQATPTTPATISRNSSTPIAQEPSGNQTNSTALHMHDTPLEPSPFWLDILNPTEEEMKVLSKTFGIHPLTTEDIFLGETREKVELFRNYYLVCFRSFDTQEERTKRKSQSASAEDSGIANRSEFRRMNGSGYSTKSESTKRRKNRHSSELTPLNMYIIVFHEGILTFHFSPTPHPMNVRRRARLLRDYITVSSDWISYALIDDITDGFAPMIDAIDDEVTYIEDSILRMHSGMSDSDESSDDESDDESGKGSARHSSLASRGSFFKSRSRASTSSSSTLVRDEKWKEKGDMLRRIGECRKRIMSILRLLGSKADVIKGFSKRCNEQWEVAPRSEIGLYLGDIQDHIVTMVQSLNHYEKLLARSHSNYLAQINIDMTRVNNDMNDVLSRITVLGTIVLPMNIVTGLWGMNVIVPGQNVESLTWFWSITFSLFLFAFACFFLARRVYDIA